ncbi:unnamed protein product [Gongylonema pulchrum]|uniref:FAM110_C domain-containing protein n=1 Tax=Gongylonema pulchrum TaxID=637853 RepID=A0A183DX15_9BILA|nr:unnamed protein product [Gongylonema pulchrum]
MLMSGFPVSSYTRKALKVKFEDNSFEDSSSISSGISENFEDISTDDLTGSSLSDYPMAATAAAYGKLDDYSSHQQFQNRQHGKRSASVSQPPSSGALRLQQRRLLEQENIDQLLQKCRTTHRGVACGAQVIKNIHSSGSFLS